MKKLKEKYRNIDEVTKKQIRTYFLLSLLIVAILYLIIGVRQVQINSDDSHCIYISSVLMSVWFLFFPEKRDKKEGFMYHMVGVLVELFFYSFVILYWIDNVDSSNWVVDTVIAIFLSLSMIHTFYVFHKINYLIKQLLPKFKVTQNKFTLFIKSITALLVSITAFFTALISLMSVIK